MAQLAEQLICNQQVIGSSPIIGLFLYDLHIGRDGRVAQVVEHLTFNQVVRGSNPRTLMQTSKNFKGSCFFLYFYLILCIRDIRDKRRGNRSYELNNKKYK